MSRKILLISASPRKGGNSDMLCDEFLRGAREAGHEAEKIRLSEKAINYCTGCCSCIGTGECVQDDDMTELRDKMIAADVLVLATPVYFHAMNGQMKTFIDRICPFYSRLNNKEVYFILAAAGGSTPVNNAIESLRTFTNCLSGTQERGIITITGVWDAGRVKGTPSMGEACEAGKNV